MASADPTFSEFDRVASPLAADGLVRRIVLSLLVLSPTYWAAVKREADLLICAYGPVQAAQYAAEEAEDALSPAWARFMRRVGVSIGRRANAG